MTAKTMAAVLAEHQWYDATSDNEDPATGCTGCDDWFGSEDALDDGTFAAHQSAALSAAGFGLVADAVVIHVAHDTEAHARSFNEGYETAMAQELADDPTTAQDWLDAKLADAKAAALEDAAAIFAGRLPDGTGNGRAYNSYQVADMLRARAAALRAVS